MRYLRFIPLVASVLLLPQIALPRPLHAADAIVINAESGALFEGIVDGFPGQFAFDGEPDLGGNQLGTALKLDVTEERGIAEFPLASLAELTAGQIGNVTLTFNIDDVLSTFGPGTNFNGRAASTLLIHVYAGDGTIQLGDYKNIAGPAHTIDTSIAGTITDDSLRNSGAIFFHVDLTTDVQALLHEGASHAGIVWRTVDSPTGTSLDDLGDGSVGPAGVGGARMPFLTVQLTEAPTPTATSIPTSEPTPIPPTATATATATEDIAPVCLGDCDQDDTVTVNEIVVIINIALGSDEVANCRDSDADNSGDITVDELVGALGRALNGCSPQ